MSASGDLLIEIRRRLAAIVSAAANPQGGTYNLTPSKVFIGGRLTDAANDTYPIYTVLQTDYTPDSHSNMGRVLLSTLTIQVNAQFSVTRESDDETTNPYLEGEQCIEDVRACLERPNDATLVDASNVKLTGRFLWQGNDYSIDVENQVGEVTISYTASLPHARGKSNTLS